MAVVMLANFQPLVMLVLSYGIAVGHDFSLGSGHFDHVVRSKPDQVFYQPLVTLILLSHSLAVGHHFSLGSGHIDHVVRRKPVQAYCNGFS